MSMASLKCSAVEAPREPEHRKRQVEETFWMEIEKP
jgi:hypothetical protein